MTDQDNRKPQNRKRQLAPTTLAVIALAAVAFLGWRYSVYQTYRTRIPPGVHIAGLDVGGLTADEATTLVNEKIAAPLEAPVTLSYLDQETTLSAEKAGFEVDVTAMVQAATNLNADLTFGDFLFGTPPPLDVDIPLQTHLDETLVSAFLDRLATEINQPMREHTLDAQALQFIPGQEERRLDTTGGVEKIHAAFLSTDPAQRTVTLPVNTRQPPSLTPDELKIMLEPIAARVSVPPESVRVLTTTLTSDPRWPEWWTPPGASRVAYTFDPGRMGRELDIEASIARIQTAIASGDPVPVSLVITNVNPPHFGLEDGLKPLLLDISNEFPGVTSLYVADLSSGETLSHNLHVVYSGMSLLKVGILVTAYRHWNGDPPDDIRSNIAYMISESNNAASNLVLMGIGGDEDAIAGVEAVNQTFADLGMIRTFMRQPYYVEGGAKWPALPPLDLPEDKNVPATEAAIDTHPDAMMQTRLADLVILWTALYEGCQGKGLLLKTYPDSLDAAACCEMLDWLKTNPVRTVIGASVPPEVPIAHKHGWVAATRSDVGIVFSPGGDYLFGLFMWQDSDWINWDVCFPLFRRLSATVYNYFNMGPPYQMTNDSMTND
ncbi:MAG: serine hydrolase [Anaerolineae bacterium]|nr:serine hydrolase [Anaerolineae bacterium]